MSWMKLLFRNSDFRFWKSTLLKTEMSVSWLKLRINERKVDRLE